MDTETSPYLDGYEAAWRHGRYEGCTETPDCPFPADSQDAKQWQLGFDDGADDHWEAWKVGEA